MRYNAQINKNNGINRNFPGGLRERRFPGTIILSVAKDQSGLKIIVVTGFENLSRLPSGARSDRSSSQPATRHGVDPSIPNSATNLRPIPGRGGFDIHHLHDPVISYLYLRLSRRDFRFVENDLTIVCRPLATAPAGYDPPHRNKRNSSTCRG